MASNGDIKWVRTLGSSGSDSASELVCCTNYLYVGGKVEDECYIGSLDAFIGPATHYLAILDNQGLITKILTNNRINLHSIACSDHGIVYAGMGFRENAKMENVISGEVVTDLAIDDALAINMQF